MVELKSKSGSKVSSSAIPPAAEPSKPPSRAKLFKVVIRRLPSAITEDELCTQMEPLTGGELLYFAPPDPTLDRQYQFSRAYLSFKAAADVVSFRDRFDGYVFLDSQGNESMAMVELAAFQRVPKCSVKDAKHIDDKCATLDNGSFAAYHEKFLTFVKNLETPAADEKRMKTVEALLEHIEMKNQKLADLSKQSTPLVDYVLAQKQDKNRKKFDRQRKRYDEKLQRDQNRKLRLKKLAEDQELWSQTPKDKPSKECKEAKEQSASAQPSKVYSKEKGASSSARSFGPRPAREVTDSNRNKRTDNEANGNKESRRRGQGRGRGLHVGSNKASATATSTTGSGRSQIKGDTDTAPSATATHTRVNSTASASSTAAHSQPSNKEQKPKTEAATTSDSNKQNRPPRKDRPEREIYQPGARARARRNPARPDQATRSQAND